MAVFFNIWKDFLFYFLQKSIFVPTSEIKKIMLIFSFENLYICPFFKIDFYTK